MMRLLIAFFLIGSTLALQAQSLSFEEYMARVKRQHPVSQQADLLMDIAAANQQKARGFFDPKLEGDLEQKSFDEKNYFTIGESFVKIPSRFWFAGENRVYLE